MSLAEVLPAVQSLSPDEQVQLLNWLQDERVRRNEEASWDAELLTQMRAAAAAYCERPQFGPEAVAALEQLLAEHSPAGAQK